MKRMCRVSGLFLCFFMMLMVNASASGGEIDVSTAPDGYFSVCCESGSAVKMKVGVTFAGKTEYFNYSHGKEVSYAFERGEGTYVVSLFRNVSGTSYRCIAKETVAVKLKDAMAPYLASTGEITFCEGGAVSEKTAELCEGLTNDDEKIVAIYNFIGKSFQYNDAFAESVRRGKVKNYVPDTEQILSGKRGVCQDFSALFAAMCRSQGIPCRVEKGDTADGYHAWNLIWRDEEWVAVDLTVAVVQRDHQAKKFSDCVADIVKKT